MDSVPRFAQIGLLTLLAFAARVHATQAAEDSLEEGEPVTVPVPAEDIANPAGGGGSSVIERVEARPARSKRLVYACSDGQVPVFSDRPCGTDARTQQLDVSVGVLPEAGSAPRTRPPAPVAATKPIAVPVPDSGPAAPDRCAPLEAALDAIDARMRQGYSAREAAHLWERWRTAKARLRDAHC